MKKELTATAFHEKVITAQKMSLVKFKTHWSGACQILQPVYEELTKTYKEVVQFFIVDIEKEKTLSATYGIIELPTILFFQGGQLVDRVAGLTSKEVLISKIDDALSNHNIQ